MAYECERVKGGGMLVQDFREQETADTLLENSHRLVGTEQEQKEGGILDRPSYFEVEAKAVMGIITGWLYIQVKWKQGRCSKQSFITQLL